MKKLLQSLFILLFIAGSAYAQDRTITGTVTAKEDGLPLPGVTVVVKGTRIGTQTGSDGKYVLSVPSSSTELVFSYLGYLPQTKSISSGNVVSAVLESDSKSLTEVVVTALGISKAKRTIGYAETTVNSEDVNKSAPVSMLGGLQGKVAGVNISNTSGAPGGSTKIILRGFTSITGSNQPLYVIDGVPLDNSRIGSDSNYDFGNNANDINPNSIENVSILKGSAATALYGSRGSNGVIIITTKKGVEGKMSVDFSTATTITQVGTLFQPQSTFGQGWDGTFIESENGNWGPKYDGQLRPWGAIVDNSQLLKPFSFIKDNVRDALDNGVELNNNISLSGGNDKSTYYFSYGNVYSDGYLPSDNDSYKRNNFTLKGSTKFHDLTVDASINYVSKTQKFIAQGQAQSGLGSSFYEDILQIPQDIPINDLRDYKNKFFNVDNYYTPYAENPFYSIYENGSRYKNDRVYGNVNLNYKVNDWLSFQFQQGADVDNAGDKQWNNKNAPSPGSYNDGGNVEGQSRAADVGSVREESIKSFEYDSKLNALFNKTFSDFNLDGIVGVNYNDRGSRYLTTAVEDLTIPGFFQLRNTSNKPTSTETESHRRLFGAYATATLGYKNYLYLTLTGRNDWTSTLAQGKNSYFYPAASLAYVVTDAFDMKESPISFLKLRASYGETGSDTSPYRINNILTAGNIDLGGFGDITFPVSGVPGYSISNQLNNPDLKPERVKEYELGGDLRFLNDRIGIDASYYNKLRVDQILPVPIDPSSGYTTEILNFGKVRVRGVEVALTAKPVLTNDVKWNLTYTFSRERNKVLELPAGLDKVQINSAYDATLVAIAGLPLGIFQAPVAQYDPQGRIIVDNTGFPVVSPDVANYGSIQRDFSMGLTNVINYKNFGLAFTFDYQKGGVFYSGTADLLNFTGQDIKSTYNDRRPFIVPNSVVKVTDGSGNVSYIENTTPISEGKIDDYYYPTTNKGLTYNNRILDKTFIKLREASLSYTLPKSIAAKLSAQNATISIFGRNLITWLPKGNTIIDPEVSNLGNDLASEFGEFRTAPPVRFFGAALRVTF